MGLMLFVITYLITKAFYLICEVSQMEYKRGEKEWSFMKKTLIILFIIGLIITIVCGIGVVNQFQVESEKSKEVTENYHKVYDNNAEVKNSM